ncbi:hypothetical protein FSP39_019684 [Pinctada imbricata]|uniref:Serine-threonine/tyrosine-protein kinase catalytic domain-containing protein n=1 Tax=Pinctada imbricata TaxID=66713 RepID=A0AA88XLK0_PINIB|nr:hypothetical protein FSP39_019684 [Pinctada imbricata]
MSLTFISNELKKILTIISKLLFYKRQPLEVIRNSEYSKDSDVYMLAMVFYEYYTAVGLEKNGNRDPAVTSLACVPFASVEINQILCNLLDGEIPLRPPECPLWLYEDIMIPCWSQERTSRPSTKQIVKMISER